MRLILSFISFEPEVKKDWLFSFIKENNQSFLTSGSKEIKDKINLIENPEILIWGVVTYVIHAF